MCVSVKYDICVFFNNCNDMDLESVNKNILHVLVYSIIMYVIVVAA